jgi:hypothetical protein
MGRPDRATCEDAPQLLWIDEAARILRLCRKEPPNFGQAVNLLVLSTALQNVSFLTVIGLLLIHLRCRTENAIQFSSMPERFDRTSSRIHNDLDIGFF